MVHDGGIRGHLVLSNGLLLVLMNELLHVLESPFKVLNELLFFIYLCG